MLEISQTFIIRENSSFEEPGCISVSLHTAISRKVVGKNLCTRQPRKVIWDMINKLFLTTLAVEPTFVAFH